MVLLQPAPNPEYTKMIDSDDLDTIASNADSSEDVSRVARALASAMNDWPNLNQLLLDDFMRELSKEFSPLSFENLSSRLARIDVSTQAWKAESVSSVLEAWSPDDHHKMLEELVANLMRGRP